jgi:hypothetical protein
MTGEKQLFQKKGFLAVLKVFREDSFHSVEILYRYFLTLLRGRNAQGSFYTVKEELEQKHIISFSESHLGTVIRLTKKGQHIKQLLTLLQQLLETDSYLLRGDNKQHEKKITDVMNILIELLKGNDPLQEIELKYSEVIEP